MGNRGRLTGRWKEREQGEFGLVCKFGLHAGPGADGLPDGRVIRAYQVAVCWCVRTLRHEAQGDLVRGQ